MSSRERLPGSPFLAYWWDFQPKAMQDQGQLTFLRKISADALVRPRRSDHPCRCPAETLATLSERGKVLPI